MRDVSDCGVHVGMRLCAVCMIYALYTLWLCLLCVRCMCNMCMCVCVCISICQRFVSVCMCGRAYMAKMMCKRAGRHTSCVLHAVLCQDGCLVCCVGYVHNATMVCVATMRV